ncbi:MAG: hypothetical protein ACOCYE_11420, partial [Pseudomonadota bacterium]
GARPAGKGIILVLFVFDFGMCVDVFGKWHRDGSRSCDHSTDISNILDMRRPGAYKRDVPDGSWSQSMKCETCAFYQAAQTQCRRNAPVPKSEGTVAAAVWPTVAADEWCGEYKSKDAAKAA